MKPNRHTPASLPQQSPHRELSLPRPHHRSVAQQEAVERAYSRRTGLVRTAAAPSRQLSHQSRSCPAPRRAQGLRESNSPRPLTVPVESIASSPAQAVGERAPREFSPDPSQPMDFARLVAWAYFRRMSVVCIALFAAANLLFITSVLTVGSTTVWEAYNWEAAAVYQGFNCGWTSRVRNVWTCDR